jgi:DNA-binding transcriptional ArsR family regulator
MTMAWKSGLPSGRKMVLLALCDNANDQGECYPSVPMLAEKCSMGERTVQQHIADLEADGIVKREMRAGRSTMYHIDPRRICTTTPAESAPREISTPQNLHPTPAESAPPPPQISHPTPADFAPITIKEPSVESSVNHQKRAKKPRAVLGVADLMALGVEQQVAEDWLAIRKEKRAPLTRTAMDEISTEIEKAGLALPAALKLCCGRGWASFRFAWLAPRSPNRDGSASSDKFRVADLDHSSSRAAMEASIRKHGITVPEGEIEF